MLGHIISLYSRCYIRQHMAQLQPVGEHFKHHLMQSANDTLLLYVHIPFCESLCPYCNFHRFKYQQDIAIYYFSALQKELRIYRDMGFKFTELYVGGGTPTINPKLLTELIETTTRLFPITRISIETNPNFLSISNINLLTQLGVNRLSVGVQSLQDSLLQKMGRLVPYGDSQTIMHNLELAIPEFDTLNVDMIFNLPGQTEQHLLTDLESLNTLKPTQISWYPLMPSNETKVLMDESMGQFSFRNESKFYQLIDKEMNAHYQMSSAWCFNLKQQQGHIDEYVVDHENYLGTGSGSFSYINGLLLSSSFSIEDYITRVNQRITGITSMQTMMPKEIIQYQLLMRLFGLRVPHRYWIDRYHKSPQQLFKMELTLLRLMGAIEIDQTEIRLTRYGRYIWVVFMREFFMGVNNYRAQMRHSTQDSIG